MGNCVITLCRGITLVTVATGRCSARGDDNTGLGKQRVVGGSGVVDEFGFVRPL